MKIIVFICLLFAFQSAQAMYSNPFEGEWDMSTTKSFAAAETTCADNLDSDGFVSVEINPIEANSETSDAGTRAVVGVAAQGQALEIAASQNLSGHDHRQGPGWAEVPVAALCAAKAMIVTRLILTGKHLKNGNYPLAVGVGFGIDATARTIAIAMNDAGNLGEKMSSAQSTVILTMVFIAEAYAATGEPWTSPEVKFGAFFKDPKWLKNRFFYTALQLTGMSVFEYFNRQEQKKEETDSRNSNRRLKEVSDGDPGYRYLTKLADFALNPNIVLWGDDLRDIRDPNGAKPRLVWGDSPIHYHEGKSVLYNPEMILYNSNHNAVAEINDIETNKLSKSTFEQGGFFRKSFEYDNLNNKKVRMQGSNNRCIDAVDYWQWETGALISSLCSLRVTQMWSISSISHGRFEMKSVDDAECMAVNASNRLIRMPCWGSARFFYLDRIKNSSNTYVIRSTGNNMCVSFSSWGSMGELAKCDLNDVSQRVFMNIMDEPTTPALTSNERMKITSFENHDSCMTLSSNSNINIVMKGCSGSGNQYWLFSNQYSDFYSVKNSGYSKCIHSVFNGWRSRDCTPSYNSFIQPVPVAGSSHIYYLTNGTECMDLSGTNSTISRSECDGSVSQMFRIEKEDGKVGATNTKTYEAHKKVKKTANNGWKKFLLGMEITGLAVFIVGDAAAMVFLPEAEPAEVAAEGGAMRSLSEAMEAYKATLGKVD